MSIYVLLSGLQGRPESWGVFNLPRGANDLPSLLEKKTVELSFSLGQFINKCPFEIWGKHTLLVIEKCK